VTPDEPQKTSLLIWFARQSHWANELFSDLTSPSTYRLVSYFLPCTSYKGSSRNQRSCDFTGIRKQLIAHHQKIAQGVRHCSPEEWSAFIPFEPSLSLQNIETKKGMIRYSKCDINGKKNVATDCIYRVLVSMWNSTNRYSCLNQVFDMNRIIWVFTF